MNEGEGHAERISDGGSAFCATSVGGDDNGLLVVGDVELDVFTEEVATVKVVNGDIEEALVLGV